MKTGIELIAQERAEQIEKHGRSIKQDAELNDRGQLLYAAKILAGAIYPNVRELPPYGWDNNIGGYMCAKPQQERLVIAGALIAAEIDRLNSL